MPKGCYSTQKWGSQRLWAPYTVDKDFVVRNLQTQIWKDTFSKKDFTGPQNLWVGWILMVSPEQSQLKKTGRGDYCQMCRSTTTENYKGCEEIEKRHNRRNKINLPKQTPIKWRYINTWKRIQSMFHKDAHWVQESGSVLVSLPLFWIIFKNIIPKL